MTDIATALKAEITRIATKQVRSETQRLKKAMGQYRSDIAALKRRAAALEQQVRILTKALPKPKPTIAIDKPVNLQRFSGSGFAAQRRRLGLSASEMGKLLGVSDQSVYKWEAGKTYPLKAHFSAIAAMRKMNKAQVSTQLEKIAA